MVLVKPATVVQWHRKGFRLYWRRRSRRLGRPRMSREIRELIRKMSLANPLWGAPRIHGELLKLGIEVSQATVGRYLPWRPKAPSPTWRSFLHNHMHDTAAVDMFVVVTARFQILYALLVLGHERREVIHFDERRLRRVLSAYFEYHHHSRTHLSLAKDCPDPRPIQPPSAGTVVAFPQVGGLHHRYERRAA
jgi:hypothetical protein